MPLPKSLVQPFRQGNLVISSGMRGYFAPFNQAFSQTQTNTGAGATVWDLIASGKFIDGASGPPAGWFDLGWVDKFKETPANKIGNVKSGYRGAIRAKYRAEVASKMACVFKEVTHLAIKIATGTQVFNLIASTASPSLTSPIGSTGTPAVALGASGYIVSGALVGFVGKPTLYIPAGSGTFFPAGTYIVCDKDYNGTDYGFVGDAGSVLFQGATTDVDYIRKTSDYVATVTAVVANAATGQDALILNKPFLGGGNSSTVQFANTSPGSTAKVQAIKGFGARGGGSTIMEWSAVFVLDSMQAGQYLWYFPRVAPDQYNGLDANNLENATSIQSYDLNASFDALAYDDPYDGETVVSYGPFYFPPAGNAVDVQN